MACPLSHHATGASNDRNRRRQPDRSSRSPFCLRFPPALQSRHVTNRTAARNDRHRRASAIPPLDGPVPPGDAGAAQPTQRADRRHRRGITAGVGSFLSVFMVRLGATDFQVGLLTAMPALTGMLLAMPAGEFLSRQRPHRAVVRALPLPRAHLLRAHRPGAVSRPEPHARGDHPDLGAGDAAANASSRWVSPW